MTDFFAMTVKIITADGHFFKFPTIKDLLEKIVWENDNEHHQP
jgi:hypothetical protein